MEILIVAIIAGVLALLFSAFRVFAVVREGEGNETMQNIARAIQLGAAAFLKREYAVLAIFVAAVFVVLLLFIDLDVLDKDPLTSQFWDFDKDVPAMSLSYLIGAILSASAGYLGMTIAVRANVRTAAKAQEGLNPALRVAFNSGTVMGMTVVGLGILGLGILYLIWESAVPLAGFAFGASSIALFARVGGGIYTKAADVGADLVGKVEAGIPEDDPRNPATIADNVGDNVGDVAGMGADLFESYVGSIVATMALAAVAIVGVEYTGAMGLFGAGDYSFKGDAVMLPLLVAGVGIFAAILSTFLVRTGEQASQGRLLWALRAGVYGASGLVLAGAAVAIAVIDLPWDLFWAILVGLVAGQIIGTVTEGFTSSEGFAIGPFRYSPTVNLSAQAESGSGPVIIGGMSLGMLSTAIPLITIVVAIILANEFAGFYGIALAAVGMLAPLGVTLATDAYGPVADNAGGIAEQAGLEPEVRERTDALDQLGNTTAATGKGFAIGSAALTALALLATYSITTGVEMFNLLDWEVMVGILIGALMPFVFSALSMGAVGRAAQAMVEEVRRQFREKPGIMDGTEEPDYERAVSISTNGALREMIIPGLLAVAVPIFVGAVISAESLGGLLIGSIAAGAMLAIMMANAGGAWDNAKKYIEEGHFGGKGSEAHKSAVVGDTVGDPFKDTSGPSLNILLKLMSIVAVVFGPLFI
ncbi:MAG: sodium-translocating pyrophosphatase [Dehalococcoidia bacterium]|nr:sodium-translocating pyrophosphatase [Dehalococcoidia bacterium]MXY88203.1 sodium-translocating pyrophosphatase [Dehalococcoidia bacterium]MXZ87924.1 sodium-translocating pyrophosphatase [Dehalococcoidia bacterium]MYA51933.1 sodium-translocating pyrophosphatase [Dehalococcoidia bacterium]